MDAAVVGGTHRRGALRLAAEERVREGGLPRAGGAHEDAGPVRAQARRERGDALARQPGRDLDLDGGRGGAGLGERGGEVLRPVRLREDDHRLRAARMHRRERPLEAARVRALVEPLHDEHDVHVGGEHLLRGRAARDVPGEPGAALEDARDGAIGPGARDDEVAHHREDALGAQPTRDDDRVGAVREPDEEAAAAILDRAADEGGLELLQGELGREEGTEADELGMDHGVPRERE